MKQARGVDFLFAGFVAELAGITEVARCHAVERIGYVDVVLTVELTVGDFNATVLLQQHALSPECHVFPLDCALRFLQRQRSERYFDLPLRRVAAEPYAFEPEAPFALGVAVFRLHEWLSKRMAGFMEHAPMKSVTYAFTAAVA